MSNPAPSASRSLISGEETRAYTLQAIPPQTFGKYTLIGKLGHGGMAEVLLAVMGGKAGFRKLVVLKRIHGQLEIEPGLVDMFLDEARLAAQLDHPNCVHTIEVGDVDGQHFLAMEYLDGQGLDRLLRSSAQSGHLLPPAIAARMVADALEGLGYAHELAGYDGRPLGVVHRDVSPQNIFVTYNGVVKLLDFGIAKAASNVVETRTGVVKGKYAYIAPEQALGQAVDHRADLWSMGVVLWECLTSRRLFKSHNELATLQETLHAEVRPPSAFNPAVPPELDAIVLHALTREVDQRYQTATEFKDALEDWVGEQRGAPSRKAIAQLMKERFEEVQRVHKEKLAACLAALEVGPSSIQRLVESAPLDTSSGQFSNMTPSSARLITPGAPPSITPTPMPTPAPLPSPVTGQVGAPGEDRGRAVAWRLVAIGAVAVIAVLIAIAIPRGGEPTATPLAAEPGATTIAAPPTTAAPAEAAQVAAPTEVAPSEVAPGQAAPTEVAPIEVAPAEMAPAEVAAPSADPVPSRRGGRRGSRTSTEPAPETAPPAETAPAADDFGYLSLVTSPWTTVTLNGRTLGDTPLMRERLPAGRHTLRLTNPDQGISETYEVEIRPGETTTRRLGLR